MTKQVIVDGDDFMLSNCITCGVKYMVPLAAWKNQQANSGSHTCSNGHRQGWDESNCSAATLRRERDRLKQRVAQKDDEIAWQRQLRETAERSASAYKGQVTKLKRRAKAGMCPCCKRSFVNLARHMATKHPDMDPEEPLTVIDGGKA